MTLLEIQAMAQENGIILRDMLLYLQLNNTEPMGDGIFYIRGTMANPTTIEISDTIGNVGLPVDLDVPLIVSGDPLGDGDEAKVYKCVANIAVKVQREDDIVVPAHKETFVLIVTATTNDDTVLWQRAKLINVPKVISDGEYSANIELNTLTPMSVSNGFKFKFSIIFNNGGLASTVGSVYWESAYSDYYLERTSLEGSVSLPPPI